MIAHDDLYGSPTPRPTEPVVLEGPLAVAATHTIAAFNVTSEMINHVGDLAIAYGVGKSLPIYLTLLSTYRTLVHTQASLAATATGILHVAKKLAQQP
ncbi:MAG: hypothetical protein V4773_14095 [Verrucomicrobiota bacterium]